METLMKLEGEFGEVKRDMEAMRQDGWRRLLSGSDQVVTCWTWTVQGSQETSVQLQALGLQR